MASDSEPLNTADLKNINRLKAPFLPLVDSTPTPFPSFDDSFLGFGTETTMDPFMVMDTTAATFGE